MSSVRDIVYYPDGVDDPYLHVSSAQSSPDGTRATHWVYNRSGDTLLNVAVEGVVVATRLRPGEHAEFYSVHSEPLGRATFFFSFNVLLRRRWWWKWST